jgi:hypothetical protein
MDKLKTSLSIFAFSLGILLSLYLTSQISLAVANGLYSYNSMIDDDFDPMPIRCPMVVSPGEGAVVSVKIPTNPSESTYRYSVTGRVDAALLNFQRFQLQEVDVLPGEGLELSRQVDGANPQSGYLVVRIRAQAGDRLGAYTLRREFAYQGRCGIAVISFLGFGGLHAAFLTIGIHFIGSILLYRNSQNLIPESSARRINLFLIALLAFVGPTTALLPIPQNDFLGYLLAASLYLNPLLIILFIGVYLSRKITSRNKSRQPS